MIGTKRVTLAPNGNVVVSCHSTLSGREHSMELPMKLPEYRQAMEKYDGGDLIQDAFPGLSADQREFLLTGITPEEWENL